MHSTKKKVTLKAILELYLGFLGKTTEKAYFESKSEMYTFLIFILVPYFWTMFRPPFGVTYISYFDLLPVAQGEKKNFYPVSITMEKKVLSFMILGIMSNKFASSEEWACEEVKIHI